MEFTEMAQVTNFVDAKMVTELKDWLVSRRDGKGLFLTNEKAGETNVISEITRLKAIADASLKANAIDAYFTGLLAASLYNLNRTDEARVYADALIKNQLP
jgi:hypothetical protein